MRGGGSFYEARPRKKPPTKPLDKTMFRLMKSVACGGKGSRIRAQKQCTVYSGLGNGKLTYDKCNISNEPKMCQLSQACCVTVSGCSIANNPLEGTVGLQINKEINLHHKTQIIKVKVI